jgi:methanogenic corrinoid protein MtbC1
MAKWTEGKKGKGNSAPQCNFIYSYVVYVVDLDQVVILEFSRTSIAAGKMLNTVIMQKGLGNFAVQLSSASSKNARGQTFYSPVINGAKVTDKVMKIAKEKAEDMFGAS